MKFKLFFLILLSTGLTLQSCAVTKVTPMREDPLIGKIIETQESMEVDFDTLIDQIKDHDVIYLSEKHDNADHHEFQKSVIRSLVAAGIKPVVAFEFFSWDQTPDILNFIDSAKVKHSAESEKFIEKDLRKKLGWDTQSDKMWQYYFDLLSLARREKLYAAGIDLSTSLKKRITRKGIEGITGPEKEMVYSTGLADLPYKTHMMETFKAVHCGMGHGRMQQRLYDTWVARNDKMALSISRLARYENAPVVVIIGGGHTEYGLGVMDRLTAISPELAQVNIALKEIDVRPAGLSDYLEPLMLDGHPPRRPAGYIRFSQRVSYEDPCEKFREQLKKMRPAPKD